MKTDVPPLPQAVPKRRAIGHALDQHIAEWLAGEGITRTERKVLEAERQRRRALSSKIIVGVVVGREGMSPAQQGRVEELLLAARATEVHHRGGAQLRRVHRAALAMRAHSHVHVGVDADRHVVHAARHMVIAAPREPQEPVRKEAGTVWALARYARHRSIPVRVVLPDGTVHNQEAT